MKSLQVVPQISRVYPTEDLRTVLASTGLLLLSSSAAGICGDINLNKLVMDSGSCEPYPGRTGLVRHGPPCLGGGGQTHEDRHGG